jgi:hypothetical protein
MDRLPFTKAGDVSMKIKYNEKIFDNYSGEDLQKARTVLEELKESAATLETSHTFNLSVSELQVLTKLADEYDAPDTDLFYVYCLGFARGREYEKKKLTPKQNI